MPGLYLIDVFPQVPPSAGWCDQGAGKQRDGRGLLDAAETHPSTQQPVSQGCSVGYSSSQKQHKSVIRRNGFRQTPWVRAATPDLGEKLCLVLLTVGRKI